MSQQWFVLRSGKQHGPFGDDQLRKLASSGNLHPTDLVQRQGMAGPVAASQIPGLFQVAQSIPSPQPVVQPPALPTKTNALADFGSKLYQILWSTTKRRIVTCIGVLMFIGIVAPNPEGNNRSSDAASPSSKPSTAQSQPASDAATVSALDLIAAYKDNELAGDKKFKGKKLIVSGSIREVGTEKALFGQSTFVELYGRDKYDNPRVKCYLSSSQKDQAADLSPDTRTTVQGQCDGLQRGKIVLKDCRFVERLNLSVSEFVQRAKGKSFTYAQFVEQFGLPSSESTPAPISDDLFLYYDLKDGSVMVSLWKASWYKRGELLIHDVSRVP